MVIIFTETRLYKCIVGEETAFPLQYMLQIDGKNILFVPKFMSQFMSLLGRYFLFTEHLNQ